MLIILIDNVRDARTVRDPDIYYGLRVSEAVFNYVAIEQRKYSFVNSRFLSIQTIWFYIILNITFIVFD